MQGALSQKVNKHRTTTSQIQQQSTHICRSRQKETKIVAILLYKQQRTDPSELANRNSNKTSIAHDVAEASIKVQSISQQSIKSTLYNIQEPN